MSETIGGLIACFVLVSFGFFFGALFRDGRALRVERALKGGLSALKLVCQSYRQEVLSLRKGLNGDSQALKKILSMDDEYQAREKLSLPGDSDSYFSRGVRHGLKASVIFIRGWL